MDTVTQKVTTRLVNLHDLQGPTMSTSLQPIKIRLKLMKQRNGPDECVMCGITNPTPYNRQMGCASKYGSRAHRLCSACWFRDFVPREDHRCPGCVRFQPLPPPRNANPFAQSSKDVVDLISSDEEE